MTTLIIAPTLSTSQPDRVFHSDKITKRNETQYLTRPEPAPRDDNPAQLSLFDPVEIPLAKGYVALVDPVDADLLEYKWCIKCSRGGKMYAGRSLKRENSSVRMHQIILSRILGRQLAKGEECDHKNNNGLDNRRSNLRLASRAENTWNTGRHRDNRSGYKGVSWSASHRAWRARIHLEGREQVLSYFDAPEDAHAAYCEAAAKYHGEFARTE